MQQSDNSTTTSRPDAHAQARIQILETQLAEARAKLEAVDANPQLGIWIWQDISQPYVIASSGLRKIYELAPGEGPVEAKDLLGRLHPDEDLASLAAGYSTPGDFEQEFRILINGQTKHVRSYGTNYIDEAGVTSLRGTTKLIEKEYSLTQQRDQRQSDLNRVLDAGGITLWKWPSMGDSHLSFGEKISSANIVGVGETFDAWKEHIHPDDLAVFKEALQTSTTKPSQFQVLVRFRADESKPYLYHNCKGESKQLASGKLSASGTLVNVHELTRLKHEASLAYDRLARVVSGVDLGIFEWEIGKKEPNFLADQLWEIVGYAAPREQIGLDFIKSIVHPQDIARTTLDLTNCLLQRGPCSTDVRLQKVSGEFCWYEVHVVTTGGDEEPLRLTGGIRNIDGRKSLERRATEVSERLSLVITGAQGGVWDWMDVTKDEIVFYDDFTKLLGYTQQEIVHSKDFIFTIVHPEDRSIIEHALTQAFETGENYGCEFRILFKGRGYRWVSSTAAVVLDANGPGAHRLTGFIIDIHEQRLAEQRLEESNKQLNQFGYIVAHDLMAPLRHIEAFSALLRDDHREQLDEEGKMFVDTIIKASDEATKIIEALLEYARTGTNALAIKQVDLNLLIRELQSIFNIEDEYKEIEWQVGALPAIEADPTQMRMLFQNLVGNAAKFSRNQSQPLITISAIEDGRSDSCTIEVRDNGVGFSPNKANSIFEVFERAHSSDEFEGMGLGLANVARIVSRHGGSIRAHGEVGVGATFWVTLPVRQQ